MNDRARQDYEWTLSVLLTETRPDPPVTVAEWADKHRMLSSKSSAEPGKWRTDRTPYLREIMDCLSSYSSVTTVAFLKGVQIGASESALNLVGYAIHHSPGPIFYVMPNKETVERISKTRLDPMIEASPDLAERIPTKKGRNQSNTITEKHFPGGTLILDGAQSGANLRSISVRYLILDEVDAYPFSADQEGDPISLAIKRTSNFARRKIFMLSTPLIKATSRIEPAFLLGDRRYYHVPCKGCGTLDWIRWKNIRWPKGEPGKAAYVCEHCGFEHHEHHKNELLANGVWIATAESQIPDYRSYHLSTLYSPVGWKSWADCAREFLEAHGADGRADGAKLQVFINTILGETYDDATGEAIDPDSLMARREDWGPILPDRAAVLTAGIDVQDDRLEVEVVAWGRDEESWSVATEIFTGDPAQKDVWERLDKFLLQSWRHRSTVNGLKIQAACIDTGGSHTARVYAWAHPRSSRKIWAIKGSKDYKAPIWPKRPSRTRKSGSNFYMVGVSAAKDTVIRRLSRVGADASGVGACHFGMDWDSERFTQLAKSESKKIKFRNGFPEPYWWKADGTRNEALDCRVYAYAALHSLAAMGFHLNNHATVIADKIAENVREGIVSPAPAGPESDDKAPADPAPPSAPSGAGQDKKPPVVKKLPGRRVVRSRYM